MTVLLDLPGQIAAALSSDICHIEPYQVRQNVIGVRQFVGSLEFVDGELTTKNPRSKLAGYTVTAYMNPSSEDNVQAERLLVQLCHGEKAWHQRLRASGIAGVHPIDGGLDISRSKDENGKISYTVSAEITVEIAAYVQPTERT